MDILPNYYSRKAKKLQFLIRPFPWRTPEWFSGPAALLPSCFLLPGRDVRHGASQEGRGGRTMFLDAFCAMEMRPASLESHCSRGKRPGLSGMSGAMAWGNIARPLCPVLGWSLRGRAVVRRTAAIETQFVARRG